jgi:TonB family protein
MSYFAEANLGIVFLYGVYSFLIGKETDFTKQRAFLLISMGCALLFPLIEISSETVYPEVLTTIALPDITVGSETTGVTSRVDLLFIVYICVVSIITASLFIHARKIYRILGARGSYHGKYFVVESSDNAPSWSFFRLIYIGRSQQLTTEDRELIVKHEMLHGQLYHSADMLFVTLLCIVFWFNPVVWQCRRTLAKVHEFQVDAIVSEQNSTRYAELLVKSALNGNGFLLAHHFNQSFILKRINMIATIKNRISTWKFATFAAAVVLYFVSVSCSESDQQAEQFKQPEPYKGEVFMVVSDPPTPVGGFSAFAEELGSVLKYPKAAKEKGIQGTVFVEFVVRPDGTMSDYKVVKGLGDECDNAALVAVSKLKPWTPGSHEGKPVAVRFVLPIKFRLD